MLGVEPLFQRLGYPDATRDILDAVLDEAARFSETVLAPLNSVGDEVGSTLDKTTGEVTTPPGYGVAAECKLQPKAEIALPVATITRPISC